MLLLAFEDLAEQVAGHKVAHPLAIGDRLAQLGYRRLFEPQITLEDLLHGIADQQLVRFEAGFAAQEQKPLISMSACFISSIDSPYS